MRRSRLWLTLIATAAAIPIALLLTQFFIILHNSNEVPESSGAYTPLIWVLGWLVVGAAVMLWRIAVSAGLAPEPPRLKPWRRAPAQATGFTTLELEAIAQVIAARPEVASALQGQLAKASIASRINSSRGCLTRLKVPPDVLYLPEDLPASSPIVIIWNLGLVRFVIWVHSGIILGFEIVSAEETTEIDWAAPDFEFAYYDGLLAQIESRREPEDERAEDVLKRLIPKTPEAPPLLWL